VLCEWSQFGSTDPYPEVAKQCFCDSSARKDINEVHAQYDYLQGMLSIQRLQASAALAETRADAQQQAAADAQARLDALKANSEAEIAKQQAKLKAQAAEQRERAKAEAAARDKAAAEEAKAQDDAAHEEEMVAAAAEQ
jgi:hypothetical protein